MFLILLIFNDLQSSVAIRDIIFDIFEILGILCIGFPNINDDPVGESIYFAHLPNLYDLFGFVGLIDTNCVRPNNPMLREP